MILLKNYLWRKLNDIVLYGVFIPDINSIKEKHHMTPYNKSKIDPLIVTSLYSDGNSAPKISKILGVSVTPVYRILKEFDITRSMSDSHKKFKINENIFKIIDTQEKAYWLGFLYADGNVTFTPNKKATMTLSLKHEDGYILEHLQKLFETDSEIQFVPRREPQHSDQLRLVIHNKEVCEDLIKLGCIPNKSLLLTYPTFLEEHFHSSFILGYFDGDGSIHINKKQYNRLQISIVGTYEFLKYISDLCKSNLDINFYFNQRHPENNNNNWNISLCGNKVCSKFLHYIYQFDIPHLKRKRLIYNSHLVNMNERISRKK